MTDPSGYAYLARNLQDLAGSLERRAGELQYAYMVADRLRELAQDADALLSCIVPAHARVPVDRDAPADLPDNVILFPRRASA